MSNFFSLNDIIVTLQLTLERASFRLTYTKQLKCFYTFFYKSHDNNFPHINNLNRT